MGEAIQMKKIKAAIRESIAAIIISDVVCIIGMGFSIWSVLIGNGVYIVCRIIHEFVKTAIENQKDKQEK